MSAARYTKELQSIAGDTKIFSGEIDDIFEAIGHRLTACLSVDRVNIWMFNETDNRIECIANFSASTRQFSKGEQLRMKDMPEYYTHLKSNKILVINDARESPVTSEIADTYCRKHDITSMLDLPIHFHGHLTGVVCYEHVGTPRNWTDEEVQFTMAANQLIALAMESSRRRSVEAKMKAIVQEKELLLKEMHHRIKNNLSVLTSLLRMQGRETDDPHVQSVLNDCETRIFSMAKIHEHLYQSQNYLTVELHKYIQQLLEGFRKSSISNADNIDFYYDFDAISMETSRAINLGLLVNEILNNITKHAFNSNNGKPKIVQVKLKLLVNSVMLRIEDNGSGFKAENNARKTLGLTLIEDLSEQIDARLQLESGNEGTSYTLQFQT